MRSATNIGGSHWTIDSAEAGPTVEEQCLVQQRAPEPGQDSYDEVTGLPLDPKLGADAIKEELMFMRKLQVYHEVLVSYLDRSGLKDKALYGTEDAAQCFDVASENAMSAMGIRHGQVSLCLYHSSAVDMSVFRHGDDFVVSGTRTQLKEFEEQVSKKLIVKHLGTLGPCTALGDVTEVRILNKIVRWVKPLWGSGREGIGYEAGPRRAELIIHHLGQSCSSRSVSTSSELELVAQQCGSHFVSTGHDETVLSCVGST